MSGLAASEIKNVIRGKPLDDISWGDLPIQAFKQFGYSEYVADTIAGTGSYPRNKAAPVGGLVSMFTPPILTSGPEILDKIIRQDPRAAKYIPIIGDTWYYRGMEGNLTPDQRKKMERARQ